MSGENDAEVKASSEKVWRRRREKTNGRSREAQDELVLEKRMMDGSRGWRQVDNRATVMTEANETKPITSNDPSFNHKDRNYIKTVANEGVLEAFRHIGVSRVSWDPGYPS